MVHELVLGGLGTRSEEYLVGFRKDGCYIPPGMDVAICILYVAQVVALAHVQVKRKN